MNKIKAPTMSEELVAINIMLNMPDAEDMSDVLYHLLIQRLNKEIAK